MMSDTLKRIIVSLILVLIAVAAAFAEYLGFPAVRYLGLLIVLAMITEMIVCMVHAPHAIWAQTKNKWIFFLFLAWLFLDLVSVNFVGSHIWMILLLLLIICGADIGAWFFGHLIGGEKVWEKVSPNKTWAGQIAGILCGTCVAVLYGVIGATAFMPQLIWIGIGVSLLSQYGDLTASYIKRKMGIKDFSRILSAHGGVLDRFDGWIYILPLAWLVMI